MDILNIARGAVGAAGSEFSSFVEKYEGFGLPKAEVMVGGKFFKDKAGRAFISSVQAELSCGVEASVARFRIYNAYDAMAGKYRHEDMKSYLELGASLAVYFGYGIKLELVFTGFIAEVSFGMNEADMPFIEVFGMDAKGIMMAGSYAMQLKARSYGEAVREILQRTSYEKLRNIGAVTSVAVSDTPDRKSASGGTSAQSVEMVSESDYEFIVKAAKRFNYEFFVEKGRILFRRSKEGASTLMSLGIGKGLRNFNISHGIIGLVETVEARAIDAGTGKIISSKKKLAQPLASIGKAKGLISKSIRVYIDSTITSKEQADARVNFLAEEMSFELCKLEGSSVGIPEILPGNYIDINGLGTPAENRFYITSVTHEIDENRGYFTNFSGKAAEVKK